MATYKQKSIKVQTQCFASDSEEASASEQEWVLFNSRSKKSTQLAPITSEDEEWNILSDNASQVEENTSILDSISDVYSGSGGSTSDGEFAHDENIYSEHMSRNKSSDLARLMPSHDGTGNFISSANYDATSDSTFEFVSSPSPTFIGPNFRQSKETEKSSSLDDEITQNTRVQKEPMVESVDKTGNSYSKVGLESLPIVNKRATSITTTSSIHDADGISPIFLYSKLTDNSLADHRKKYLDGALAFVHDYELDSSIPDNTFVTQTTNSRDVPAAFNRNILQGRQALLSKYSSLSAISEHGQNNDDVNDSTHITQLGNHSKLSQDPMAIEFSPTIPKNRSGVAMPEDLAKPDDSSKQTQAPTDRKTLFSAFWTSFRRFTSTIMNADTEVNNDFSHTVATPRATSNNQQNFSGLASVLAGTGENHYTYDGCYLPFGNHLTLSELGCFTRGEYDIWSSQHHSTLKHQNSLSSSCRDNTYSRPATTAKFLTPVSSSTSLKSFASRAGSDCGLESGRRDIVRIMHAHSALEQECI